MIFIKRARPRGLTIIELMVTISLMVLLLTISSVVYRRANKRTEIILTAQQIASTLRLAQSYASSSKEYRVGSATFGNIWGVYFKEDEGQIIMFVDLNNNYLYDGEEEKYRVINFPPQIKIIELTYKATPISALADADQGLAITFVPPDPKTFICLPASICYEPSLLPAIDNRKQEGFILLRDEYNMSVKKIGVNFFGLIDVVQ